MKHLSILILFIMSYDSYSQNNQWEIFELHELSSKRVKTNRPWLEFINKASMRMGLYELAVGGTDNQTPHQEDEVYYVVEGSGILEVGDDTYAASPGSLIYVKAHVPHQFVDIKEDLKVLVIFSKTPYDVNDMDWKAWEMKDVFTRKSDANEWNPFLTVSTLQWGMYMLPQKLGAVYLLPFSISSFDAGIKLNTLGIISGSISIAWRCNFGSINSSSLI